MLWGEMPELLSLRGVRLYFARGERHVVPVLEGVSLALGAGEVVCVWAQRGQGKTTLMRVAAGLERPDGGQVLFAGRDVWGMSVGERAQLWGGGIGWVEREEPQGMRAPVLEHVALFALRAGGRREAEVLAREALGRVGVGGCAEQPWGSLDEVERVRVALARALVRAPRVLVADDLTATLGVRAADGVIELVAELARERGIGVLASVSDLSVCAWSDRVGTLFGGVLTLPAPAGGRGDGVAELPRRSPFAAG